MIGKAGLMSRRIAFSPTQLPSLSAWWDASDSATLQDDSSGGSPVAADGDVAYIEDKSGNGRHWSNPVSGQLPIRKTSVQNSLDVVRFDGSTSRLYSNFTLEDVITSTAYTVFAVAKCSTASFNSGTPPANEFLFAENFDSGFGALYFRSSDLVGAMGYDSAPGNDAAETAYTIGSWAVFTQRWDGTDLSIRVDGGTAASTASEELVTLGNPATLGFQDYNNTYFDGDLGELLVFNVALSDSDREKVESYLADKWNP